MDPSDGQMVIQLKVELIGIDDELDRLKQLIDELERRIGNVRDTIKDTDDDLAQRPSDPTPTATHDTEEEVGKEALKRQLDLMSRSAHALDNISDAGVGFIQKTFGLIESIYGMMKRSSPLLQAIEQLFDLAWTLFFMPLGNKLGELLIPAVIQLLDEVTAIWDAFEGMTLGEMFSYAIVKGVEILAGFLETIGNQLIDQGGLVGSIGRLMLSLSDFIRDNGANIINTVVSVMTFVIEHLKEIMALIIAFKAMSMALGVAQLFATYTAFTIDNFFTAGTTGFLKAIAATSVVGAAAGIASYALMADGGYVPARDGGTPAVLGEGGEGEYVIPESKVDAFVRERQPVASAVGSSERDRRPVPSALASSERVRQSVASIVGTSMPMQAPKLDGIGVREGDSYTINNYCYSTDELESIIERVTSKQIAQSRFRGGFR